MQFLQGIEDHQLFYQTKLLYDMTTFFSISFVLHHYSSSVLIDGNWSLVLSRLYKLLDIAKYWNARKQTISLQIFKYHFKYHFKAVFHKFYLVHSWIPCPKCTKNSLHFHRRFSFHDVNITLSLPRNSDNCSSSMLRVLKKAFVADLGGDDTYTWLDDALGHIEGRSFNWDFPLTSISSKRNSQCNAQTFVTYY